MAPGDSLIGKIEEAIDKADYLLVILSPDSAESKWMKREVRMAMHREIAGQRVMGIPVLNRDCDVPGFLRDKLYVDFRTEADFFPGLNQVCP